MQLNSSFGHDDRHQGASHLFGAKTMAAKAAAVVAAPPVVTLDNGDLSYTLGSIGTNGVSTAAGVKSVTPASFSGVPSTMAKSVTATGYTVGYSETKAGTNGQGGVQVLGLETPGGGFNASAAMVADVDGSNSLGNTVSTTLTLPAAQSYFGGLERSFNDPGWQNDVSFYSGTTLLGTVNLNGAGTQVGGMNSTFLNVDFTGGVTYNRVVLSSTSATGAYGETWLNTLTTSSNSVSFGNVPTPAPVVVVPVPVVVPTPVSLPPLALYLTEAGNTAAISPTDIYQGQIGDCFLLATIGEVGIVKPSFISSMITQNANGTETVKLYAQTNGSAPTFSTSAFKPISEIVTNTFLAAGVDNGATQDVVGTQKEIWPQVLEKAITQLDGGYAADSNGGYPALTMEEMTGKAVSWMNTTSLTASILQGFVAASDLLVFVTPGTGTLPGGIVNDHCYMFDGITGSGAAATAKFLNPWGIDNPPPMLLSNISKSFVQLDIGHT